MKVVNNLNNNQIPVQPKAGGWTIIGLIKTACIGLLLLSSNVFAAKDLCRQNNTRALCEGHSGILRLYMPQIEGTVRDAYLFDKFSQGYTIQHQKIPAHQLTPTQSEISHRIVINMVKSHAKGDFNPCERTILVSNNGTHNKIIDGHHTAAACRLIGGEQDAIVIREEGNEILPELQQLSGSFRRDLDDSISQPLAPKDQV